MTYEYIKRKVNGVSIDEQRLIMEIILGRKLDYDEIVHHIDGNKKNNDISNLEIISRSEHSKKHMTGRKLSEETKNKLSEINKQRVGEKVPSAKLTKEQVIEIRRRLTNGEKVRALALEYGVNHSTISNIKNYKSWKDCG